MQYIFNIFIIILIMCMCSGACVYEYSACESQKIACDLLELELQVMSH